MVSLHGGPINTTETTRSMPDGTPLPPGIYHGIAVKTGQRETQGKNGNPGGIMVEVEFDITHPEEFANAGRKFWDRFNIQNASAEAQRIGRECLADLGLACGHQVLEDDEQLQGQEVMMRLAIEEGKDYVNRQGATVKGKPQNRCLKYWPVGTNVEEAERAAKERKQGASTPAAAVQQASSAPKQSWNKPAAASAATQPVAAQVVSQQSSSPQGVGNQAAGNVAPWKRKQ